MQRQRKTKFKPRHDQLESRSLLSLAVLTIQDNSSYDITFGFRWTSELLMELLLRDAWAG